MTTIKMLPAAVIATFVLILPANANDSAIARRNMAAKGGVSVFSAGRWGYLNARIPALHGGEFVVPPHEVPGGVCDHGDNAMVC